MAASHGDHGDADEEHGFEDKERTREHQQKAATGWPDPRRWEPKALYILTLKNPIRKFAILLCEHGRLDFVVLVAIVASTAAMALSDPFDTPSRRPESPIRGILDQSSFIFSCIFVAEVGIKVIAHGLVVGPRAYLKESWNVADCTIAVIGAVSDFAPSDDGEGGGSAFLRTLRSFRALRPLRTIARFPDLRAMVELIAKSGLRIVGLFLLIGLFVLVFGLVAQQMWGGQMRQRCYDIHQGLLLDSNRACSPGLPAENPWNPLANGPDAASGFNVCPQGAECLTLMDQRFQGQNYDDIGRSMSVILQLITLKGWTEVMTRIQDSFSPLMLVFFLVVLLLGPLYLMLMFQVVLIKTLHELRTAERNKQLRLLNSRRSAVALSVSFSLWADITVCAAVLARNAKAELYLVANGCDFRFRAFLQARHSFSHWHNQCASVIMGEKPAVTAALMQHQQELDVEEGSGSPLRKSLSRDSEDDDQVESAGVDAGGERKGVQGAEKTKKRRRKRKRKSWLRSLAMSKSLESAICGVIVLNALVMIMDMDRQSWTGEFWPSDSAFQMYLGALELLNTLFTIIFTGECLIKIVGMGTDAIHGDHLFWPGAPLAYFRNGFNIFDFVVVILTGIQIPASVSMVLCYMRRDGSDCDTGSAGVSVLRMFRLARLVRLVRSFPQVQEQVLNLIKVARPATAHSTIMFIFIIIAAIMGKDLLGAVLIDTPKPLSNLAINARVYVRARRLAGGFARVHPARVLRVEEQPTPDANNQKWPIHVEVVQGWSILALRQPTTHLQAQLPSSQWEELAGWSRDPCAFSGTNVSHDKAEKSCQGGLVVGMVPRANFETMQDGMLTTFQLFSLEGWDTLVLIARRSVGPSGEAFVYVVLAIGNFLLVNVFVAIVALGFGEAAKDVARKRVRQNMNAQPGPPSAVTASGIVAGGAPQAEGAGDEEQEENTFDTQGVPLRVCGLSSGGKHDPTCRYYMGLFVTSKLFDRAILGGIVLSTVLLSIETYPPVTGSARQVINDANMAVTVLFAVELVLKVLWFGPVNYIANGWNKMDAFLVFTSAVDEILTSVARGAVNPGTLQMMRILRVFRCLRALRALRFLRENVTLRMVFSTLGNAAAPISITMVLALLLVAIIANLGQSLFSGELWRCSDVWVESEQACSGLDGSGTVRRWQRNALHFDWIGHALVSVFVVSTNEGWSSLMHVATDSGDAAGRAVVQDSNSYAAAYFAIGVLLGNLICLNMFKGVFVDVFARSAAIIDAAESAAHPPKKPTREELPEVRDVPNEQESMLLWSSRMLGCPCQPYIPVRLKTNDTRVRLYGVINDTVFEAMSMVGLVASTVFLSIMSFKPAEWQREINDVSINMFATMIGSEISLRMLALHPRRFFVSPWESLDVFVLLATYMLICLRKTPGVDVSVLKFLALHPFVFRAIRLLKVLYGSKLARASQTIHEIQSVVVAMVQSMRMLASLYALLLILSFIFAVAGIQLFGNICTEKDVLLPGRHGLRCQLTAPAMVLADQFNFKNLPNSLMVLTRTILIDGWSELMRVYTQPRPNRAPGALESAAALLEANAQAIDDNQLLQQHKDLQLLKAAGSVSPTSLSVLDQVRELLPVCLSGSELKVLQDRDLLVCKVPTCDTTCGIWFGYFYFIIFIICSVVVLLNLVLASLLKSYSAILSKKPLSRQIVAYNANGSLTKQRFKHAYMEWRKRAQARKAVMKMLYFAREAALRDRDALMDAIVHQNHGVVTELLRKLLPAEEGSEGHQQEAGHAAFSNGDIAAAENKESGLSHNGEMLADELRTLSNQILHQHVSREDALGQMLDLLNKWRPTLRRRAAIAAAAAEGREYVAQGYQVTHQGFMKKRGQLNAAFKRRYFLIHRGTLAYYKAQSDLRRNLAPQGRLSCKGMSTKKDPDFSRRFIIYDSEGREMVCECDEESERDTWIEKIAEAALALQVERLTSNDALEHSRQHLHLTDARNEDILRTLSAVSSSVEGAGGQEVRIVLKGQVKKKGQVNSTFKNRFFVLSDNGILAYYASEADFTSQLKPKGEFSCRGLTLTEDAGHSKIGFLFTIFVADASSTYRVDKSVECACQTDAQRRAWLQALSNEANRIAHADHAEARKEAARGLAQEGMESREMGQTEEGIAFERVTSSAEWGKGDDFARLTSVFSDTDLVGVALQGWVWKRGDWRNPTYQKRWFILQHHADVNKGMQLSYWKSQEDAGAVAPQGSLLVQGMLVETDTGTFDNLFAFAITPKTGNENGASIRRIVLACESAQQRLMWTGALTQAAQAKSTEETLRNARIRQVLLEKTHDEGRPYEGLVYKKGDLRNPAFQKRWFVLREQRVKGKGRGMILEYFKSAALSSDVSRSQGSLVCLNMTVEEDTGVLNNHYTHGQSLYCFAIKQSNTRRMVCGCESAHEREIWTQLLRACAVEALTPSRVTTLLHNVVQAQWPKEDAEVVEEGKKQGEEIPGKREETERELSGGHEGISEEVMEQRANVVIAIDTASDHCMVTRAVMGADSVQAGADGYIVDALQCCAVIARALKCERTRVLVAEVTSSDADLAGMSSTQGTLLLVEFLGDDSAHRGEREGRGESATDLLCRFIQLMGAKVEALQKLAVMHAHVPRANILPKVTTHSLVPVPPRLKKHANKTDRVHVQGQLGYVEAGMTMAVARLDPTAIAEQAGRDMQTRVHLRQAAQISTRAVLRWHRLVSAWERYCKANVLDVDKSACLLSLSSSVTQSSVSHSGQRRERELGVTPQHSEGLLQHGDGRLQERPWEKTREKHSSDVGQETATTIMSVDVSGRAKQIQPALRHIITSPTGGTADDSEVFDGVFVWKKYESRKFLLPFWFNAETGQTSWQCPSLRPPAS